MTKKKRGHPDIEELLARPWCYYCERDFDDLKILISHQKAKHFKCDRCNRRLNTAGGLSVHMNQVHKETLTAVDNALPNRSDLNVEIFGMEGIPDDVVQQHQQRVLSTYAQAEADRRASGNSGNGGLGGDGASKKPKFEAPGDLKARLAAHKAKKAQEAAGGSSGSATPTSNVPAAQSPVPKPDQASFHQHQYPSQASAPDMAFNTTYAPPSTFQQQHSPYPPAPHPYGVPPTAFPPQQHFPPGMPSFPPPQHFPQAAPHLSPQAPPLGAGSPPPPLSLHNRQQSPPQNGGIGRSPGLPPAPGLPQRPSFTAPPLNHFQMQQMHHGHIPPQHVSSHVQQQPDSKPKTSNGAGSHTAGTDQISATAADVDDLIASAVDDSRKNDSQDSTLKDVAPVGSPANAVAKKPKKEKEKEKPMTLVYFDNEVSPEEKMAKMPRYAFDPSIKKEEVVLGSPGANVSGANQGQDDVLDRME